MNLIGIENIVPYDNALEFKVYKYDDKIDLGDKELFVCDLVIILNRINESYVNRLNRSVDILALVKNLNENITKQSIKEDIKEFVFEEVIEENLQKENIDVMFIES